MSCPQSPVKRFSESERSIFPSRPHHVRSVGGISVHAGAIRALIRLISAHLAQSLGWFWVALCPTKRRRTIGSDVLAATPRDAAARFGLASADVHCVRGGQTLLPPITWFRPNGRCVVNQWSSARDVICGILGRGTGRHKGRRRDAAQFAQSTADFWMALS